MDMAILFGLLAISGAIVNVILSLMGKDARDFMFLSLSFTAITVCFAYDSIVGLERDLVLRSDNWFALTIASILINSVALIRRPKR